MTDKPDIKETVEVSLSGSMKPYEKSTTKGIVEGFRQKMMQVPGFRPPEQTQGGLCPLPNCSQEQMNEFRSAGVLLQAIAAEARAWSEHLPKNYRPAIVALLHGNMQMEVRTLAQVSFDGIRVEGEIDGNPCSVLAHQDTIQLMCYAICTDEESEEEQRPIGFIWPDRKENV